jgi:hypothetical protein
MKNLIKKAGLMLICATLIVSCSNEENFIEETKQETIVDNFKKRYVSGIMNFENEKDFLNFIEEMGKVNESELNAIGSLKKGNLSQIGNIEKLIESPEEDESFVGVESKEDRYDLVISLSTRLLFNSSNEVIINNQKIKLNEEGSLINESTRNLNYGFISNNIPKFDENNNLITTRAVYNWNHWQHYQSPEIGGRKIVFAIYNQTAWVNGSLNTNLRLHLKKEYKSCSFWRCTWKQDTWNWATVHNHNNTLGHYFGYANAMGAPHNFPYPQLSLYHSFISSPNDVTIHSRQCGNQFMCGFGPVIGVESHLRGNLRFLWNGWTGSGYQFYVDYKYGLI